MTDEQINEVMRLVRDAVVTNSLFATGQIADMSIVGEAKYALEAYLRTIGEPESVNAELLGAIEKDRDAADSMAKDLANLCVEHERRFEFLFHAGYQLACDEVMHRLLTEEWDGCLTPPGKQEDDESGGA